MTTPALAAYLDRLDATARAASAEEETTRRELLARIRKLEEERAFGFRRLNFMRALVAAVAAAKDEGEAAAKGAAAFFDELSWTGASEPQRQALERFLPVIAAIWEASRPDADEAKVAAVESGLAAFESWYAETRKAPFASALGREVVELPLVEVS